MKAKDIYELGKDVFKLGFGLAIEIGSLVLAGRVLQPLIPKNINKFNKVCTAITISAISLAISVKIKETAMPAIDDTFNSLDEIMHISETRGETEDDNGTEGANITGESET